MATISFLLRGRKEIKSIVASLSIKRGKKFEKTTGLRIHQKQWSKDKGLPKQNSTENKNLSSRLRSLKNYLLDQLNQVESEGRNINKEWFALHIDIFFGRVSESGNSNLVIDSIDYILDTAEVRVNQKGGIGLSRSRINDYKSLKKIWNEFDSNSSIRVSEIDIPLADKFLLFLINKMNYRKGYAMRIIANLKTVCSNAQLNGLKVSDQLKSINAKQQKNNHIIFLTEEELEMIKNATLIHPGLLNARKWLILGCWIGQRGSDLLNLSAKNVKFLDGLKIIELTQQKTNKTVSIPVLPEAEKVLSSGWPYPISLMKLNLHIKKNSQNLWNHSTYRRSKNQSEYQT